MNLSSASSFILVALVTGSIATGGPDRLAGTLSGTVLDASNERPIPGAEVHLLVAGERRLTNVDGRFSFGDLDVRGPDTLVFRHLTYDSLRLPIDSEDLGDVDLDFLLSPIPIELEGFDVRIDPRAREEATRLAGLTNSFVWDVSEFGRYVPTARHIADPLRWSGKVAFIREFNDGTRCIEIRLRAGCAQVMINNVRVNQDVLATYSPEDIQSYVVMRPMEATTLYGTGAAAGVVVVFLKGR